MLSAVHCIIVAKFGDGNNFSRLVLFCVLPIEQSRDGKSISQQPLPALTCLYVWIVEHLLSLPPSLRKLAELLVSREIPGHWGLLVPLCFVARGVKGKQMDEPSTIMENSMIETEFFVIHILVAHRLKYFVLVGGGAQFNLIRSKSEVLTWFQGGSTEHWIVSQRLAAFCTAILWVHI